MNKLHILYFEFEHMNIFSYIILDIYLIFIYKREQTKIS